MSSLKSARSPCWDIYVKGSTHQLKLRDLRIVGMAGCKCEIRVIQKDFRSNALEDNANTLALSETVYPCPKAWVFPNADGGLFDPGNYRKRVLKPLAEVLAG